MTRWKTVFTLDSRREHQSGGTSALADAIRAGADMRVGTDALVCKRLNDNIHYGRFAAKNE